MTDEEIVKMLREAYTAVQDSAKADAKIADEAGVVWALDSIRIAGRQTKDFFERFRKAQAEAFADGLPSLDGEAEK